MTERASDTPHIHDIVAIGLGPFNLGLAALVEPVADLDLVCLDENPYFDWHPGLLLEGATLQTPFLADLVTLADPTSRYSFLNFLKATGRIYAFYIREQFGMLRVEYNQYCRWVAEQLAGIVFDRRVTAVHHDSDQDCYTVTTVSPVDGETRIYHGRHLVLGTGPNRFVPECCRGLDGPVFHAVDYLAHKDELADARSVTLVGSGQSAAEIFQDRLAALTAEHRLDWFTRSPRFFAMAYDKLTLELTSPEYIDYFHALPEHTRQRLSAAQKPLYKGIDRDLSAAIFDTLYEKQVHGITDIGLQANAALTDVTRDGDGRFHLSFTQTEQGVAFTHVTDALILATGFTHGVPDYVTPIADRLRWDSQHRFDVSRSYAVDRDERAVFVQNAELHTHGFTASDLGMACYRNAVILREITGREVYPVEQAIAFQTFDARAHVAPGEQTDPQGQRHEG